MSDQNTPTVNSDIVASYLKENPDFFLERDDLLLSLTLPHNAGQAISLVERQVNVLRERNTEFRQRLNNLLNTARDNDLLFEKTRRFVLGQMEAKTINNSIQSLQKSLKQDFECDCFSLILFNNSFQPEQIDRSRFPFVRVLETEAIQKELQSLLGSKKTVCGHLLDSELELLFPLHAAQVGSAAVVSLTYPEHMGILAIGSFDTNHFRSSMGSLFISHIGDVASRKLAQLALNRQETCSA